MFDNKKEREEWIKTLKVGDEVAIRNGRFAHTQWSIYKIVKITPSGRFNLEQGTVINPDGSVRGNIYSYIHEVTEEIRNHIWRRKAEIMVSKIDVKRISDEQIMMMLDIYKEQNKS
ncbi:hypothetical protein PDN54_08095 [Bacillus cereus group sp. Bc252]|uniref:hypothetical protein n=1 Tax=Bacillus TaxID=1386 RepID=UPI0021CF5007|nr:MULTISPECIES: hypothetical protein [Bacillus cereus group]MCU5206766.1 hypothetical protein [Bacillus paranthracis]MDA2160254.1 hypothetical protein [Bacillus cereus group sp. Bc252]HDR7786430.1 hypothetical protein [Bacillus paranthracis]